MDSYRDWGHSYDYVRAMHLMMQHDKPGDWIGFNYGNSFSKRNV